MSLSLQSDPLPLRMDQHGSIRFEGSRVTLDIIMEDYKAGLPVEKIAQSYDTVAPAAVYAAIAYYLRHTAEVDEYLRRRDEEAERMRELIEREFPVSPELVARIRARWAERNGDHASPAE